MKFFFLLLSFSLLLLNCRNTRFSENNLPENIIKWGQTGGFVGKTTTYILLENGQIFKKENLPNSPADWHPIPDVNKKIARGLFSASKNLELRQLDFDQPGNMTYFLELQEKGKTHRIAWGRPDTSPEQKVLDYYEVLQQIIPASAEK